jgi:anti-sigma regulatory factor (Ser/Thr protein kinase)
MNPPLVSCRFTVSGENLLLAGEGASALKRELSRLCIPKEVVRRACVCMFEGEINMAIHAGGGEASFQVTEDRVIEICLQDHGPGIPDLTYAMQEGVSTADASVRSLGFGAGMGLPNMKKCSDRMEIKTSPNQGTEVKMWVNY